MVVGKDKKKQFDILKKLMNAPKSIIIYTWAQVCKALPYGGVLHRRNPEPFHRLLATCQLIDATEDHLTLASGIAGIYHLRHIRGIHQLFENIKLLFLIFSQVCQVAI